MQALLAAVGETWGSCGHSDLANLVQSIAVPDNVTYGSGMPPHLAADYAAALEAMDMYPGLRSELERSGSSLAWTEGPLRVPDSFRGRYCYVELAGPSAMIAHQTVSFGLYLQKANTVHPSHWHEAVEHYLVLSGTANWQMDNLPFVARKPGDLFMHASNRKHATTTHEQPLLALWFWQGNISDGTYRIAGMDA